MVIGPALADTSVTKVGRSQGDGSREKSMRTDQTGPLQIGQVLIGLLEDVAEPEEEEEATESAPSLRARRRDNATEGSPSLFELMLAAVDKKFDAADDGPALREGGC
jgi:hypothetical protein